MAMWQPPSKNYKSSSIQTLIFPTPTSSTMPTSGKTYFIINKKANTAFDLSGKDQRSIIGFGFHGGPNQKV